MDDPMDMRAAAVLRVVQGLEKSGMTPQVARRRVNDLMRAHQVVLGQWLSSMTGPEGGLSLTDEQRAGLLFAAETLGWTMRGNSCR